MHRKQQHQHETQPESRHHLSQDRQTRDGVIHDSVPIQCGEDAERETQQDGGGERRPGELQGIGQSQADQLTDGDSLTIGDAEVAPQCVADIACVLREHRAIESERMTQIRFLLRGCVAANHQQNWIAAGVADDEGEKRDSEEHRPGA